MKLEVLPNTELIAKRSAAVIAEHARSAFAARGCFLLALSGGRSARTMLRTLGKEEVPWGGVHILQVHERIPRLGSVGKSFSQLREVLLEDTPIHPEHIHPMPVRSSNVCDGLQRYVRTLERLGGCAAILDLVHLELFADGHTASLLLDDPVLRVYDQDVAVTAPHQGWRHMTLTYPIINRARQILWIAAGNGKDRALFQLENADPSIPASGVRSQRSLILTEPAAAGARRQKHYVM